MADITQLLQDTMEQARAMHAAFPNDDANKETKDLLGNILKTVPQNGTAAQPIVDAKPGAGAAIPLPNMGRFSPPAAPVLREKCAFENSALLPAADYHFSIQIMSWTLAKTAIDSGEWFAYATSDEDRKAKEEYLTSANQMLRDMYPLLVPSLDAILGAIEKLREEHLNASACPGPAAAYAAYIAALPDRIAAVKSAPEFAGKEIDGEDLHSRLVERTVRSVPKYLGRRTQHVEVKEKMTERIEAESIRCYRWQF
ncbi:hypothetical protein QFC20_002805 [Naganishia adeliensis]|uniref:Uncharacterized protein n=1 Tax=Naganishia adeliensis TaxID=92952 RepID=A0ACC2WHS8_9TREE|nr:hypothetical protein QFC20_002805 [Naganishia adeliensis]